MIAAGLRSDEAASLMFDDILKQDKRTALNIKGKGAKDRVVPTNEINNICIYYLFCNFSSAILIASIAVFISCIVSSMPLSID